MLLNAEVNDGQLMNLTQQKKKLTVPPQMEKIEKAT
jgi:hypothetical protein